MEEMEEETVYELIEEHNQITIVYSTDLFVMVGENKTNITREVTENYHYYMMIGEKKVLVAYYEISSFHDDSVYEAHIYFQEDFSTSEMVRFVLILNNKEYTVSEDNSSHITKKTYSLHEKNIY